MKIYDWNTIFDRCIGIIYFFAFLSLFIQYEGLYSDNGLLPISEYINNQVKPTLASQLDTKNQNNTNYFIHFPSLFVFSDTIGLNIDCIAEYMILLGIISSLIKIIGFENIFTIIHVENSDYSPSLLVNVILWLFYSSIVISGRVFMSFQWDILLLEVGFLHIISSSFLALSNKSETFIWNVAWRFLFFKLMFMSGIVKLQASCPTWNDLTALSYHFASQCLPTSAAYYAHYLPYELLRTAVAFTLVIEIPATFLLLAPYRTVRQWGVILQLILQVSIIITGNYTFFNILTIVLSFKCWQDDTEKEKEMVQKFSTSRFISNIKSNGFFVTSLEFLHHMENIIEGRIWLHLTTLSFLVLSACTMYTWDTMDNTNSFILRPGLMETWQPYVNVSCLCALLFSCLMVLERGFYLIGHFCSSSFRYNIMTRCYNAIKTICIMICCITYIIICCQPMNQVGLSMRVPSVMDTVYQSAMKYRLVSGYGLFRRMTGVGDNGKTARPEVVVEGLSVDGSWKEIDFMYKPTNLFEAPQFLAPHQPRLDWQMWFAALGHYQNNAWLVNLALKLMNNDRSVINLINSSSFDDKFKNEPPRSIRAWLYEYDFAEWTSRNKSVDDEQGGGGESQNVGQWWQRSSTRKEYLPALELSNESLRPFLESHGIKSSSSVTLEKRVKQCIENNSASSELKSNFPFYESLRSSACQIMHMAAILREHTPKNICIMLFPFFLLLIVRNIAKMDENDANKKKLKNE